MRRRLLNLLVAIDQLAYVLLTFGHGSPDETLSAAAYRLWLNEQLGGSLFKPLIDTVFLPLERVAWALTVVAAIGLSRGLSLKAVLS